MAEIFDRNLEEEKEAVTLLTEIAEININWGSEVENYDEEDYKE